MNGNRLPGGSHATVRFGTQAWNLELGSSVTFGRSDDCDIVLTGRAEDRLVSRQAGRLLAVDGGLLVTNESRQNPIYLRRIPGAEVTIDPRMTVGTMPSRHCRIVTIGSRAEPYTLDITCHTAEDSSAAKPDLESAGGDTTLGAKRIPMPNAQRRYLSAVCEPMLTKGGAAPANYKESGKRCGVVWRTVKNSLDLLRQRLSEEYGIRITHSAGPGKDAAGAVNFLPALADWAIRTGNVTLDDVAGLDRK